MFLSGSYFWKKGQYSTHEQAFKREYSHVNKKPYLEYGGYFFLARGMKLPRVSPTENRGYPMWGHDHYEPFPKLELLLSGDIKDADVCVNATEFFLKSLKAFQTRFLLIAPRSHPLHTIELPFGKRFFFGLEHSLEQVPETARVVSIYPETLYYLSPKDIADLSRKMGVCLVYRAGRYSKELNKPLFFLSSLYRINMEERLSTNPLWFHFGGHGVLQTVIL